MSEAKPAVRGRNMPPWEIMKPQGKNRYMVRIHPNTEVKTASGLVIAETTQDIATTGDIVALSPHFETDLYPDMKVGMCVKVGYNGWRAFKVDGEYFAVGDAASVLTVYDPEQVCQE